MKYNNVIKYKSKPTIIAICGKSAAGKDTLARWLVSSMKLQKIPVQTIVSDTTRPPRNYEINGVDYNYLTAKEFYDKINLNRYLEYSNFNNWFYGTDKSNIVTNKINVGVFNPDGLLNLITHSSEYNLICIYLKCNIFTRLNRSYNRERKIKLEFFRRAFVDYYDFKDMKNILKDIPNHYIINTSNKNIQQTLSEILLIINNYSDNNKKY